MTGRKGRKGGPPSQKVADLQTLPAPVAARNPLLFMKPGAMIPVVAEKKKPKPRLKSKPGVWVTKEGQEILIVEMEDGHIANTIAMLERKIDALEKDHVEFEDYADEALVQDVTERFRVKIGVLQAEQARRVAVQRKTEAINNMLRIEMEGPELHDRIV